MLDVLLGNSGVGKYDIESAKTIAMRFEPEDVDPEISGLFKRLIISKQVGSTIANQTL